MDLQIIFPANDKLIRKYTQENFIIFKETPDIYTKVKPFSLIEIKIFLDNKKFYY